jgi:hypothetical protein
MNGTPAERYAFRCSAWGKWHFARHCREFVAADG